MEDNKIKSIEYVLNKKMYKEYLKGILCDRVFKCYIVLTIILIISLCFFINEKYIISYYCSSTFLYIILYVFFISASMFLNGRLEIKKGNKLGNYKITIFENKIQVIDNKGIIKKYFLKKVKRVICTQKLILLKTSKINYIILDKANLNKDDINNIMMILKRNCRSISLYNFNVFILISILYTIFFTKLLEFSKSLCAVSRGDFNEYTTWLIIITYIVCFAEILVIVYGIYRLYRVISKKETFFPTEKTKYYRETKDRKEKKNLIKLYDILFGFGFIFCFGMFIFDWKCILDLPNVLKNNYDELVCIATSSNNNGENTFKARSVYCDYNGKEILVNYYGGVIEKNYQIKLKYYKYIEVGEIVNINS